jgi:hypothetical protein
VPLEQREPRQPINVASQLIAVAHQSFPQHHSMSRQSLKLLHVRHVQNSNARSGEEHAELFRLAAGAGYFNRVPRNIRRTESVYRKEGETMSAGPFSFRSH